MEMELDKQKSLEKVKNVGLNARKWKECPFEAIDIAGEEDFYAFCTLPQV